MRNIKKNEKLKSSNVNTFNNRLALNASENEEKQMFNKSQDLILEK